MDDNSSIKERPTEEEITSDGLMTMIARYDATATVLANIFYYVIANPHV